MVGVFDLVHPSLLLILENHSILEHIFVHSTLFSLSSSDAQGDKAHITFSPPESKCGWLNSRLLGYALIMQNSSSGLAKAETPWEETPSQLKHSDMSLVQGQIQAQGGKHGHCRSPRMRQAAVRGKKTEWGWKGKVQLWESWEQGGLNTIGQQNVTRTWHRWSSSRKVGGSVGFCQQLEARKHHEQNCQLGLYMSELETSKISLDL